MSARVTIRSLHGCGTQARSTYLASDMLYGTGTLYLYTGLSFRLKVHLVIQ
jgi:hypothetical protein